MYYVTTFLGFWDPSHPPSLRKIIFSTESEQNLAPPPHLLVLNVIYEWSLT